MGNKKDEIIIEKSTEKKDTKMTSTEVQLNQELSTKLTLRDAPPPMKIGVTVVRIDRTKPRKVCPAREWRKVMKERNIKVYSLWFPHMTSVEMLIQSSDMERMNELLAEMKRVPVNPDAYKRWDGLKQPPSQESIERTIDQRLQMLQYETSGAGVKYLEQTIKDKIGMIEANKCKEEIMARLTSILVQRG